MLKRIVAFGLVAVLSLGFLSACVSTDDDETPVASPAQSSNAPAIFTATAQSELEASWTPTPAPEHEEGTGEGEAGPSGPVDLEIVAVDIAFETTELSGPADTDFTITLTNNGAAQHDLVIKDTDFATAMLNAGESDTITVNLPAGEYTFICSVPGHEAAGMVGTLIISEGGGATIAPADDEASAEADTDEDFGDDAPPADVSGEPVDLEVSAVDIAFDVTELEAPAGTDFTITLTNNGAAQHDLVIEGTDFKTEILNAGQSETITVNLPAGEYIFYCSVPGHRPAGMEGTLIVTEGGGAVVAPADDEASAGAAEDEDVEESGEEAPAAETGGEPVDLEVSAVDIAFDVTKLEAPAGTDFTITLTNNGAAQHDLVIEGTDFKTEILNAGQSETITVNLPAGEYIFYCSVPGHRPAGMEGTLIVTEGGGAAVAPADDEASDDAEGEESAEATPSASPEASPEAGGESLNLDVSAVDIAFDVTELEAPADTEFTITLTNDGNAQHDLVIEGTDFKTTILNAGQSETITVNLPAGEYIFYCSIPGHRPAGMEGTLIVS